MAQQLERRFSGLENSTLIDPRGGAICPSFFLRSYIMRILLTGTLLIITISSFSQLSLSTAFNKTFSGRNITFIVGITKKKSEIGLGLRFNINKLAHNDDQFNVYKDRLYVYPDHSWQHLGLNFYHHFIFYKKGGCVLPFVFYDVQLAYAATRNRSYLPYSYNASGKTLYMYHLDSFGPFGWIEPTVGAGMTVNFSDNFFLRQKAGFGVSLITGIETNVKLNPIDWSFCTLIHIGVGYRFLKSGKSTSN